MSRRRTKAARRSCLEALERRQLFAISIVAVTGDAAPGGTGEFAASGFGPASLSDDGKVAFIGTLDGTGGTTNNTGIYVGTPGGLEEVVRTGNTAPDGNGQFDTLNTTLNQGVSIDATGEVAFNAGFRNTAGGTGLDGLFMWDGTTINQLARARNAAPDGNGIYADTGSFSASIAPNGVVMSRADFINRNDSVAEGLVQFAPGSPAEIVLKSGDDAPDSDGDLDLSTVTAPVVISDGSFAVRTSFANGTAGQGVIDRFINTGNGQPVVDLLGRAPGDVPVSAGGGTFAAVGGIVRINENNQVAFTGDVGGERGIFRSTFGTLEKLVETGDSDGDGGTLAGISETIVLGSSGTVLFKATGGLFEVLNSSAFPRVQVGDLEPTGVTAFTSVGDDDQFASNALGQVVFAATLGNQLGTPQGLFFLDPINGNATIATVGDPMLGSTITDLSFATGNNPFGALERSRAGLNDSGKVAFNFTLSDGRSGVATWTADVASATLDFGDAADTYRTTLSVNGPSHVIAGPRLGFDIDDEADGNPTDDATGDGADDDGVSFEEGLLQGQTTQTLVAATATSVLDAFIDFNADGNFDTDERLPSQAMVAGDNSVSITVPEGAVLGDTTVRFRISTAGGLDSVGPANDGEVEDYIVTIAEPPPPATVQIAARDGAASEKAGNTATLRVTRVGETADALTVTYSTTGAIAGLDFSGLPGSVVIPAGKTFAELTLIGIDNAIEDGDRDAVITLTPGAGYAVGAAGAVTVPIDDDEQVETPNANAGVDLQIVGGVQKVKPGSFVGGAKGGTASVSVLNVSNTGATASGLVSVTFFASIDGAVETAADAPIATVTKQLTLKPGKAKAVSAKFNFPTGLIDGNYFIVARADAGNGVTETLELNNDAASPIAIGIAAPFVDYAPSGLTAPATPIVRGAKTSRLKVSLLVTNSGNVPTTAPVITRFFFSTNGTIDGADTTIGDLTKVLKIKPGATGKLKGTIVVPSTVSLGTFTLLARVDAGLTVTESNEGNNDTAGPMLTVAG